MKKYLAILLVVAMVLVFASCSNTTSPSASTSSTPAAPATSAAAPATSAAAPATSVAASSGKSITVGWCEIDYTNAGFIGIKNGADKAAKDYNVNIIWKGCNGDLNTQIDQIRGFIQQKVDVIVIDAVDVNGLVSVVNEAADAGINVLAIGSSIPGKANYNAVYPDYVDSFFAAEMIGNIYAGKTGTIGLITGSPGNSVSDQRQKGFEDGLKSFTNLKLVEGQGKWDATAAMTAAQDIINSNPDLLHLHCIQDGMSYGVLQAVKASGKNIPISSNDGDPQALDNMQAGSYILENYNGAERIGYWFTALSYFIGNGYKMDKTQYDATYKIMSDDLKTMAVSKGLDTVNGTKMTIINLDQARAMADQYTTEFSINTYKPTNTGN